MATAQGNSVFGYQSFQTGKNAGNLATTQGKFGQPVADPGGPHFWGPRLYSETPNCISFYTQKQNNLQKNFASLHSAYYFNSHLTYFDQKH